METIRILIANDSEDSRNHLRDILQKEKDFQIVGEAVNGEDALNKCKQLLPDIILMDDNMPVMDGLIATEKINLNFPQVSVIIISLQSETKFLKKAMKAGAREYLVEPINEQDLIETIKHVNYISKIRNNNSKVINNLPLKEPQIITVFGSKGGVGKTTISANLAALLANKVKAKVALVDLDLQFGDIPVFFNVIPRKSIVELVQEKSKLNIQLIEDYLLTHISKVKILPAPLRPEYAELIKAENVSLILEILKQNYDYIIIDTPPFFHDTTLSALEMSNQLLLIMTLDLPSIKNMKLTLDLLEPLNQKSKSKLILNRATEHLGISVNDVEKSLDFLIAEKIPSDGKLVVTSVNKGMPFVLTNPNAKVSKSIDKIAQLVVKDNGYQNDLKEAAKRKSLFSKIFGLKE
ncbi:MAG: pilus assembly protein CpaE [Clostridia bacterium]|nr:pilus assembly protein CpaE [Clostridia bacterium]